MTMTAARLYEIVKDVPKDAWPKVWYDEYDRLWHEHWNDCTILPDLAKAAFVGAMVAWLIKEGSPSSFTLLDMGDFQRVHEYHDGTGYEIMNNYDKPTLIEALAAACKATKGGGE